jgi:hypothetical protein
MIPRWRAPPASVSRRGLVEGTDERSLHQVAPRVQYEGGCML